MFGIVEKFGIIGTLFVIFIFCCCVVFGIWVKGATWGGGLKGSKLNKSNLFWIELFVIKSGVFELLFYF